MVVSKAFYWFSKIAEKTGAPSDMKIAADLGHMKSYAMLRANKDYWEYVFDDLSKALVYADVSYQLGIKDGFITKMNVEAELGHAFLIGAQKNAQDEDKFELYAEYTEKAVAYLIF